MIKSWKIKTWALGCLLAVSASGAAADTLLASTELQQEQGTATAQLWGNRLPNGYADDLLVLLKDKEGRLIAAYAPSIKGGYNCLVQPVQIKSGAQQLLVSVGQGDWQAPTQYRILDFADAGKVQELFDSAAGMGIVTKASINEAALTVDLLDGSQSKVQLPQNPPAQGRMAYGGLHSLAAYDVDNDGLQELLSSQQIKQGQTLLADVGAGWDWDADTGQWKHFAVTIMTAAAADKSNTVNDGVDFSAGAILPRKLVVPGGEATYPVFAGEDVELQNKINKALTDASADYLQRFYRGEADMAFKVVRADSMLLTVQLISGKQSFVHHHVHLDPATGEQVKLGQILNLQDKDLLPLLNVLNTNKNVEYTEGVPSEWYIEGNNLYLLQNICGKDEVSGFALGNLHKFLLDKKWLQQKN